MNAKKDKKPSHLFTKAKNVLISFVHNVLICQIESSIMRGISKKNNQKNNLSYLNIEKNNVSKNQSQTESKNTTKLIHINKIINKECFFICFLFEDKHTGIKVVILKTEKKYIEQLNDEKYILQQMHNKGNFPRLIEILFDDEYYYYFESLTSFSLKQL